MEKQYEISANRRIIIKDSNITIDEPGSVSKTVTLTPKRWISLVSFMWEIDQNLASLENNQYVKYCKHLGGSYYVGITTGFPCVDIRQYYYNTTTKQALPTKNGVAIYSKYWPKFKEIVEQIQRDYPSIAKTEACSHLNLVDLFNCLECHPFKEEVESIKEQLALPETFY